MSTISEAPTFSATRDATARRRLPAATLGNAELCVHALAQVREEVHLVLQSHFGADLRRLAEAYGLGDRVHIAAGSRGGVCGRFTVGDSTIAVVNQEPEQRTLGELVEAVSPGLGAVPLSASKDDVLSGERVVVLTNYPAHYRLPLFELMSRELEAAGTDFSVLFLASEATSRPWLTGSAIQFDHTFVPSIRLRHRRRALLVPSNLERALRARRPTIVLSGGLSPFVSDRAARVAREVCASFGIWSGETGVMATAKSNLRRRVRQRLVLRADFAVAYGARSADYLRGLRRDLPVVIGRNSAPVPGTSPIKVVDAVGGAPARVVLIGDLADTRKGVDVALAALRLIPDADLHLSVIGGGRLLGPLSEHAQGDPRVNFLGPLAPHDVAGELARADVLLFPTRADVFGLALVEAMGAEVAPIVSSAAGATDDLAVDRHNAVIVAGHEPERWAAAIEWAVSNADARSRLAQRARATIEARWTIRHAAGGMIAGLRLGAWARSSKGARA